MSDAGTVSSASSSVNTCNDDDHHYEEVDVENPTGGSILQNEFQEALDRLNDVQITPDLDIAEMALEETESNGISEEIQEDCASIGSESSNMSKDSKASKSSQKNGDIKTDDTKSELSNSESKSDTKSEENGEKSNSATSKTPEKKTTTKDSKASKTGSVFSRLKRLTKFDKTKKSDQTTEPTEHSEVKIDKLPQCFVAKYLGKQESKGVHGLQYTRRPVDKMVSKVKKELNEKDTVELPLVYVVISGKGIDIRQHRANKVEDEGNIGLIPIDFISYGVQDIKYWRVFTFIVVNEMASRSKDMKHECHAVLCDNTKTARKMALSLGAAFGVYKRKLHKDGKSHNFTVELRPPEELAEAYSKETECEA